MNSWFYKFLKLDWVLLAAVVLLLGIGLLALYSLSSAVGGEGLSIFWKQAIYIALGISALFFFVFSDYQYLKSYSTAIYFATLFLLVVVLLWGSVIRGTSGWIGIGPFHIQPVEIAKLSLIIFLASFISQKKSKLGSITKIAASFVLAGIMIFLVAKQPDFGSAMVLSGIWIGMLFLSGINRKHLIFLIIIGILISASGWFLLADYQKFRIINVVKPEIDPKGSGYNVIQSMISVGSGGITGKGFGHGSQSQLNFLPEKHTDFIFAVIAEELGLLGSFLIIFLYLALFYRIRKIAVSAQDNFGYLLAAGVLIMFFLQIFVNIGMNIGIVPVTGIPLPFLSYGGSSLVAAMISLGVVLNIYLRQGNILE